jgi:hypothetical protein
MRWIKLFEKFDSSDYYVKLDSEEFLKLWGKCIWINQKWVDQIEDIFQGDCKIRNSKEYGKNLLRTPNHDDIFPKIQKKERGVWLFFESDEVFIWEIPDEYFIVVILPLYNSNGGFVENYRDATFWKCDQIDAIEKLIIDVFSEDN